jgi:hypothetical protein
VPCEPEPSQPIQPPASELRTAPTRNRPPARPRTQEEFEKLDIERANLDLKKRPKVRAVD